jgi:hypothetical protein
LPPHSYRIAVTPAWQPSVVLLGCSVLVFVFGGAQADLKVRRYVRGTLRTPHVAPGLQTRRGQFVCVRSTGSIRKIGVGLAPSRSSVTR